MKFKKQREGAGETKYEEERQKGRTRGTGRKYKQVENEFQRRELL